MTIITPEELKTLMHSKQIALIDIRDAASYNQAHIPNAMNITASDIPEACANLDKQVPVVVYCYKGFSSQQVAKALSTMGFAEVYNLEGGFSGWATNAQPPDSNH